MPTLNVIIWSLIAVLAVMLILSFVVDFGAWFWVLGAGLVLVFLLDMMSRRRRR